MKKHELSQYYDRLSVWERIRLLIEAYSRRDETEATSLLRSSPQRSYQLSEHELPELVLHNLASTYIGEQLDAAAHYFFALWRYEHSPDPHRHEWLQAAQADADFFRANAEIWRQFCSEQGLSAESLTAVNHGGLFLRYCEEHMPDRATAVGIQQAWPRIDSHAPPRKTIARSLGVCRKLLRTGGNQTCYADLLGKGTAEISSADE